MWVREWKRFYPEDTCEIREVEKITDPVPETGHLVCTYNFARVRRIDLCHAGPWDALVVDEWHEVRGPDAQQTRALLHPTEGVVKRCRRLWALTGTPCANNLSEFYPILRLAGVYNGSRVSFIKRYCKTYYDPERGAIKIVGVNLANLAEFHELLDKSGIMLRRLKSTHMPELPPIEYEYAGVVKGDVDLEALFPEWAMSDRMQLLVERIEEQRAAVLEAIPDTDEAAGRLSFAEALDILSGLAQSISELRLLTGMQKVASVVQVVGEELDVRMYPKIFLAAWHRPVIEGLMHGLRRFEPAVIHGGVTGAARARAIDRFTDHPDCRVMIVQVRAGGPAVNLTARGDCYEAGVVEQSFVPGENAQVMARAHRIGARYGTRVRLFRLDDPMDRRFEEIVFRKSLHISSAMRESVFLCREFDPIEGRKLVS